MNFNILKTNLNNLNLLNLNQFFNYSTFILFQFIILNYMSNYN